MTFTFIKTNIMIKWNSTKEETQMIVKIAKRAFKLDLGYTDFQGLQMDITAVHLNDAKLRLQDLLESDNLNFCHDVNGINRHINRNTGKLENCFLPRFSQV